MVYKKLGSAYLPRKVKNDKGWRVGVGAHLPDISFRIIHNGIYILRNGVGQVNPLVVKTGGEDFYIKGVLDKLTRKRL